MSRPSAAPTTTSSTFGRRSAAPAVGPTTLGTPLKTRTVIEPAVSSSPAAARPSPAASPSTRAVRPTAAAAAATTPARPRASPTSTPSKGAVRPSAAAASSSSSSSSAAPSASPSASPQRQLLSRQRYDSAKAASPFSSSTGKQKTKTAFASAYVSGSIPCRLYHGSGITVRLSWSKPSSEIDYHSLLPIVAEGIRETDHPYVSIARKAWSELLAEGGSERVLPVLPRLIAPLRAALMDPSPGVFAAACDAIVALSSTVAEAMNPHLDQLLQQIHKKSNDSKLAEKVNDTIATLANNGGEAAIPLIKAKVPTFAGV